MKSMTIKSTISTSFAVLLAASIAFYFWSSPPKEWASLDYESVNLEELKVSIPGFAGDSSFKDGFGWVDRTLGFENRLRILEGVSPNSPDEKKSLWFSSSGGLIFHFWNCFGCNKKMFTFVTGTTLLAEFDIAHPVILHIPS